MNSTLNRHFGDVLIFQKSTHLHLITVTLVTEIEQGIYLSFSSLCFERSDFDLPLGFDQHIFLIKNKKTTPFLFWLVFFQKVYIQKHLFCAGIGDTLQVIMSTYTPLILIQTSKHPHCYTPEKLTAGGPQNDALESRWFRLEKIWLFLVSTLTILTPPIETQDPPFMTPLGPQNRWQLDTP